MAMEGRELVARSAVGSEEEDSGQMHDDADFDDLPVHFQPLEEEGGSARNGPARTPISDFAKQAECVPSSTAGPCPQPSASVTTRTSHHQPADTRGSPPSLNEIYVCQHCSAVFVLLSSLKQHMSNIHHDKLQDMLPVSSSPDSCGVGDNSNLNIENKTGDFADRKTVEGRKDKIDNGRKGGENKIRAYVCDVCNKAFTQAGHLKRHKRIHTGEKPYKCPHCDSAFNQSAPLQSHIRAVHTGDRPFVCDVCGAAFSWTGHLSVHKRIHTGQKPHVCSDCGKGFTNSSNLKKHQLIHTGEKPHVCTDCGKGFTLSSHLKTHLLTHTGQKPHTCPHCPAAFTQLGHLKRHMENLHQ